MNRASGSWPGSTRVPTFKLTLAYDGTRYHGWQRQRELPTIQGELETALARVSGQSITTVGSSRTDAGVHALGQVVSLALDTRLEADVLARAVNAFLPDDIVVREAAAVRDDFHAIADTIRKRYRYVIDNGAVRDVFSRTTAWHLHRPLDAEAMHRAGQALVGRHDFRSFETHWPNTTHSVRTIFELCVARGTGEARDRVTLEVEADGFLYNMVRSIVGTLVAVGHGRRDEAWPAEVLAAQDRCAAGRTAPPEGLCLLYIECRD